MYLDHFRDAVEHADRGLRVGRATGRAAFAPTLVPVLGTCAWMLGEVDRGVGILEEAVEVARISRNDLGLAWGLLNLSLAQAVQGDVEAAVQHGAEACALADSLGDSAISSWAGLGHGIALLEAGSSEEALRSLSTGWAAAARSRCPAAGGRTRRWRSPGRRSPPATWRSPRKPPPFTAEAADETGLPMARSWADRARAELLLAQAKPRRPPTRRCAPRTRRARWAPGSTARRSRELAGRALLAAGDPEGAAEQLELAAKEFDECNAEHHRDRVELELGKLGRRPSRRSRPAKPQETGLASLSGRELEVANLVVDRLTNAQIAAELFLSEKTIESHLRNIFGKLGASSRVEVARIVEKERAEA